MAIYTKKGDKGETGLFGTDKRCSKDSPVFWAIGRIDELNSYLGICIAVSENPETSKIIKDIQSDLLEIGSILGGSDLKFYKTKAQKLEKHIDRIDKILPKLSNFILPGGTLLSSHLHYARSLSRRAERGVVRYSKQKKVKPQILIYLNRLSDYLFMLARSSNNDLGKNDEIWKQQ